MFYFILCNRYIYIDIYLFYIKNKKKKGRKKKEKKKTERKKACASVARKKASNTLQESIPPPKKNYSNADAGFRHSGRNARDAPPPTGVTTHLPARDAATIACVPFRPGRDNNPEMVTVCPTAIRCCDGCSTGGGGGDVRLPPEDVWDAVRVTVGAGVGVSAPC